MTSLGLVFYLDLSNSVLAERDPGVGYPGAGVRVEM